MVNHYYLMRHGESLANRQSLIISDPKAGRELYGLSDKGKEQARAAAQESSLPRYTMIVSSDFCRARETAQIVKETLKCKPEITLQPGLRERFFGKLEGRATEEYKLVWVADSKDPHHTPYGAESPRHLAYRLRRVIEGLEKQYQGATILLVSHGDPLRFLQLEMAGRDLTEHMEIKHFQPAEIRQLGELVS
ncbi:MAG: histidine phosphatase family protein [Vulcanimicrobiota bacterium]